MDISDDLGKVIAGQVKVKVYKNRFHHWLSKTPLRRFAKMKWIEVEGDWVSIAYANAVWRGLLDGDGEQPPSGVYISRQEKKE